MRLERSERHVECLVKGILLVNLNLRLSLHLPLPFEEDLFHASQIEGVESVLTPKVQLELIFPLDQDLATKVEESPLPELLRK